MRIKNTQNIQIQALRSSISNLEGELLVNTAQYGSQHSAVTELNKRIKVLKNQLEKKINESKVSFSYYLKDIEETIYFTKTIKEK